MLCRFIQNRYELLPGLMAAFHVCRVPCAACLCTYKATPSHLALLPAFVQPSLLSGMASLFNKGKPEAAKLAVRVLQARSLSYGAGYAVRDSTVPYVAAVCEGSRQLAAATNVGESPTWEAFFLFNVLRPKFAILRIKVLASGGCCSHRVIGEVEVSEVSRHATCCSCICCVDK